MKTDIKKKLTPLQIAVTKQSATEPPFLNEYWNNVADGIYVDIYTGCPLFSSLDKFDSGCGWPSFSKPLKGDELQEKSDDSHSMQRTEVRSKSSDSHLGHIFNDGPIQLGGMRYCINSAAIEFIPVAEMEKRGYADLLKLFNQREQE